MASTDSRPVARKNVAFRVYFPLLDADGDLVTGATGLDSELSKDGGTFADCGSEATEIATASGCYFLDLTNTEMNADCVVLIIKTSSVGAKTTVIVLYPEEVGDYRADVVQWLGTAAATPTVAGVPEIDVTHWNGTAVATPDTVGYPKVTIKDGTGTGELDTASGAVILQTGAITAAVIATDAIDADAIADGAINAASVATDVIAKLRALATGTADSGSTSTMVDAALTQADTDYWKGCWIVFTSGTLLGQVRLITGFNAATDTVTFSPVTTQAVSTHTYEILPAGGIDIRLWAGSAPNGLVTGRVDASVGAVAADAITAAGLAADVTTELQSGLATSAALATAQTAIDAIPTNAELATALAAADDAVLAAIAALNNLSAAAVNAEVVDALNVDTYAEPGQQAPPATATLTAKIGQLYKAYRNKFDQTATTYQLYNDAGSVVDQKATVSDSGTVFERAEVVSGP